MPPFAALPSRGSREFTPPFAALPSRGSRDFLPPFAAQRSRRSRELTPPFAALPSRRSREFTPPFADHPALSSQGMTPPSTANPSPPARLWLNARRPASDSMPAGLPLTQCPPACLWLKLAGLPLTQARRIAADSSSPDCRWLKLAGLPLTQARRIAADSCPLVVVGRESQLAPHFTPPSAAHRPRRSREITPPSVGKANPPSAAASSVAGKANPPSAVHSARSRLRLPPARRPLPLSGQASRLLPLLSSQPIMVSPAGRCRIDKPAGRGRIWPDCDQGLFNCFSVFSPGGLLIPLSFPKEILGGGSRAPAEETEVGAGAAVSEAVPPWPPELPAPPWPPELPAPPWPPELPAPPWPPELPAPPGPRSVCSTLEAPSCVCICVGPVGSPECPPPLPGSTVTARDVPSGRGELC